MNQTTKKLAVLFASATIALTQTSAVIAQTSATPSTNSANLDQQLKDNIKNRIEEAVRNNPSEILGANSTKLSGRIGLVESITDQTISLNIDGVANLVAVTPTTQITTTDDDPIQLNELEIDSPIIAIGSTESNEIFTAQKIISLEQAPEKSDKQSILATINDSDTKTSDLTLTPKGQNQPLELNLLRSSSLSQEDPAGQLQDISQGDLNPADTVLIIYQPSGSSTLDGTILKLHRLQIAPDLEIITETLENDTDQ